MTGHYHKPCTCMYTCIHTHRYSYLIDVWITKLLLWVRFLTYHCHLRTLMYAYRCMYYGGHTQCCIFLSSTVSMLRTCTVICHQSSPLASHIDYKRFIEPQLVHTVLVWLLVLLMVGLLERNICSDHDLR